MSHKEEKYALHAIGRGLNVVQRGDMRRSPGKKMHERLKNLKAKNRIE